MYPSTADWAMQGTAIGMISENVTQQSGHCRGLSVCVCLMVLPLPNSNRDLMRNLGLYLKIILGALFNG